MKIHNLAVVALVAASLAVGGCSKKGEEGSSKGELGSVKNSAAGTTWTLPKAWSEQGARSMRVATYAIPAASGDAEGAECAVFYFGPDQGGTLDANIDRWAGQFEGASSPVRSEKDINGVKVVLVQINGAYLAPSGPMMQSSGKKDNYRLLGAIVSAPAGPVFFKLVGPAKTVAASEGDFNAMVGSLIKQ